MTDPGFDELALRNWGYFFIPDLEELTLNNCYDSIFACYFTSTRSYVDMKKLVLLVLSFVLIASCDPVASMEATIENKTDQFLSIEFVSRDPQSIPTETYRINPDQSVLFQDVFDVGNTYLEPYLLEYDSIVLRDQSNSVIKVYKQESPGKNIYHIQSSWLGRENPKRNFFYVYQLDAEDLD